MAAPVDEDVPTESGAAPRPSLPATDAPVAPPSTADKDDRTLRARVGTEAKASADAQPEDDGLEESVTQLNPRLAAKIPLSIPHAVEIRDAAPEDELLDETEVRTLPGVPLGHRIPKPAPAAGRPPEPPRAVADDVEDDDGATTEAMRPPVTKSEPPATATTSDPPTRPAARLDAHVAGEPPTRPGLAKLGAPDAYEDDSVTSRAIQFGDDSVTTRGPAVSGPVDDATDGTTQRKESPPASPADDDAASITTEAPGHLTNMLRVMAADAPAVASTTDAEDDVPENRTEVMANSPLFAAANAALKRQQQALGPEPKSESGLRLEGPQHGSAEHASLGALGVPPGRAVIGDKGSDHVRLALANTEAAMPAIQAPVIAPPPVAPPPAPAVRPEAPPAPEQKAPRYGLLVGVVAVVSLLAPILLYVALRESSEPRPPAPVAEPGADHVRLADTATRAKAKAAPASSATVTPPGHRGPHR